MFASALDWSGFPEGGRLEFVSAGCQDSGYSTRINAFNWNHFYTKLGGGIFLEEMKRQLRTTYDYVLIDSRTGVSDTSGICTVQMPDTLVICFTLNEQSIEGAASTAASASAQRRLPTGDSGLRVLPVPARVVDSEKERLDRARQQARLRFDQFLEWLDDDLLDAYWGEIEIPHKAFYSFEEVLAVFGDAPGVRSTMLSSMESLTSWITEKQVAKAQRLDENVRQEQLDRFLRPAPILATQTESSKTRNSIASRSANGELDVLFAVAAERKDVMEPLRPDRYGFRRRDWIPFGGTRAPISQLLTNIARDHQLGAGIVSLHRLGKWLQSTPRQPRQTCIALVDAWTLGVSDYAEKLTTLLREPKAPLALIIVLDDQDGSASLMAKHVETFRASVNAIAERTGWPLVMEATNTGTLVSNVMIALEELPGVAIELQNQRIRMHPDDVDFEQRGELTPCQFTVDRAYRVDKRWRKWGDPLIRLVHSPNSDRAYLMPSAAAPEALRKPGDLRPSRGQEGTLGKKQELTEQFLSKTDGATYDGFWFYRRMTDGFLRPHAYAAAYDQFLSDLYHPPTPD
jgi:FxsC-like protein